MLTPVQKPNIPVLGGIGTGTSTLIPTITRLTSTLDAAQLTAKLPGVTITTITPSALETNPDIDDLLQRETDESEEAFEARRRLTMKLKGLNINGNVLNNATAVVVAFLLMKKTLLGLEYDPDVEATLRVLVDGLSST